MKLSSNDIQSEQMIDSKYTCDGDDISPHLKWSEVPEGTKSFSLSCLDPDATGGEEFAHWLVINLPVETMELGSGSVLPDGTEEILNDFGFSHYGGPCPGSGTHRYYFRVYAMDIDKLQGIDRVNFKEKVEEHAIDVGELMGYYKRN